MKINWKVRIKNKTFWVTAIPVVIAIIYTILSFFGVVPKVSQSDIVNVLLLVVELLSVVGVVIDPTTSGASDSDKALTYETPAPSNTSFLAIIKNLLKRGVE